MADDFFKKYMGLDDGVTVFAVNIRNDNAIEFHYAEPGDLNNGCVRTKQLIVPMEAVDLVDVVDSFRGWLNDAEVFMRNPRRSFIKGEPEQ